MARKLTLEEVRTLREKYITEPYGVSLTQDLLISLYQFITSPMVEERNWFSDYDKSCILSAYELLGNSEDITVENSDKVAEQTRYNYF